MINFDQVRVWILWRYGFDIVNITDLEIWVF